MSEDMLNHDFDDLSVDSMVLLANRVILKAIKDKFAQVQLEVVDDEIRVSFSANDESKLLTREMPLKVQPGLFARLKSMAALDLQEKTLDQRGRMLLRCESEDLEFDLLSFGNSDKLLLSRVSKTETSLPA